MPLSPPKPDLWRDFRSRTPADPLTLSDLAPLPLAWAGFGTSFAVRRTQDLQHSVERHNTRLAEQGSDARGNIAVVQSFTRIRGEIVEAGRLEDIVRRDGAFARLARAQLMVAEADAKVR